MKSILIVTPSFSIGGTNSSLSAFLSLIDPAKLKVDILAQIIHRGHYRQEFKNCHILDENVWINERILYGSVLKKIENFILRGIRRLLFLIGIDVRGLYTRIGGLIIGTKRYDAVISYQEDLSWFISFLPAKKRIAWIRCEYGRYFEIHHHKDESKVFKKINTIVCVSNFAKDSFIKYYPDFEKKTMVIHNFMDVNGIKEKAEENIILHNCFDTTSFTIVSIGRIDRVKQFELIPLMAKDIKKKTQRPFKWYIIGGSSGDVELDSLIRQRIIENSLEETVFLLGEITNVSPYLSRADIFVHTSKSETFSRVVNEAKVLCVPPVINDYACSGEFVENGVDGIIVNNSAIADTIVQLMDNPNQLDNIRCNLHKGCYDNSVMMKQVFGLLNS